MKALPERRLTRSTGLILILVMALILAACGGSDADDEPTTAPDDAQPTEEAQQPTAEPTDEPQPEPTDEPTLEATEEPQPEPTDEPTSEPTEEAQQPTDEPQPEPTDEPTLEATEEPQPEPTDEPTSEPTEEAQKPTDEPTDEPTEAPAAPPSGAVPPAPAANDVLAVDVEEGVVPDVTGLRVPIAAALLNRSGYRLGAQTIAMWEEGAPVDAGTIGAQSIAAGEPADRGSAVDYTLYARPTVSLIYDNESMTVFNRSGGILVIDGMAFVSEGDGGAASYSARSQWRVRALGPAECAQIRTPGNVNALPQCTNGVQAWWATRQEGRHFWTGWNGATEFTVTVDNAPAAVCQIAAGQCDMFLPVQSTGPGLPTFIYVAYTTDRLIIMNTTSDRWMPLTNVRIFSYRSVEGGELVPVQDPAFYGEQEILANIRTLAPGQCIFLTSEAERETPPQNCDVVAHLEISPESAFWTANFGVANAERTVERTCPAPSEGRLSLCILPTGQ